MPTYYSWLIRLMGRRDIVFQHTAHKYIARTKDDDFHLIETDALDTLDHFLSECSVICDDNIISDLTISLVSTERVQENGSMRSHSGLRILRDGINSQET